MAESKTGLHTGLGILSLVIGILALMFSFIPCIGSLALYVAPVGVIIGIAGYVTAKNSEQSTGLCSGGILVSGAATVLAAWQAHNVTATTNALENLRQSTNIFNQVPVQQQPAVQPQIQPELLAVTGLIILGIIILFVIYKAFAGRRRVKGSIQSNIESETTNEVQRDGLAFLSILTLGVMVFCGYWFFLRHTPAGDAKIVINKICACNEAASLRKIAKYENFIATFADNHFKRQREAQAKLQSLLMADDSSFTCLQDAYKLRGDLRSAYASDIQSQNDFDNAYSQLTGNCGSDPSASTISKLQEQVDKEISDIDDSGPTENEIETALLGKDILGWHFDLLSNFKHFNIDSVTNAPKRKEYQISLVVGDATNQVRYPVKIIVVYNHDESGWVFNSVKELSIQCTYTALVNEWTTVATLSSNYIINSQGSRYWIRGGDGGQGGLMGGPDITVPSQPSGDILAVMSREDHPIDVVFTYYPKNE